MSSSLSGTSITIKWNAPINDGGVPITSYLLWIDDGAGNWPGSAVTFTTLATLSYTFNSLTASTVYAFKIKAINAIGSSKDSDTSYFACADLPDPPSTPVLETSTTTSISIGWSAPVSSGGMPITGYKVYINNLISDDWVLTYDGSNFPATLTFK